MWLLCRVMLCYVMLVELGVFAFPMFPQFALPWFVQFAFPWFPRHPLSDHREGRVNTWARYAPTPLNWIQIFLSHSPRQLQQRGSIYLKKKPSIY